QLQIQAVHQAQRPELILGELARQAALHLAAELRGALGYELGVGLVVSVHGYYSFVVRRRFPAPPARRAASGAMRTTGCPSSTSVRTVGPNARMTSRISVGRTWPFSTFT